MYLNNWDVVKDENGFPCVRGQVREHGLDTGMWMVTLPLNEVGNGWCRLIDGTVIHLGRRTVRSAQPTHDAQTVERLLRGIPGVRP